MTRRLLIHTEHIKPPIPDRNHDWQAVTDNYEPGQPIGHGQTEADAVYDLYMQIEEREWHDEQELLDATNSSDLKYRMWRINNG